MSNRRKVRAQITGVELVQPKAIGGGMNIIILERVEPGVTPEYCVHGQTTCYGCDDWCWLGDRSYEVVQSGEAAGLCQECALKMIPPGTRPAHNVEDHRRADGPH